MIERERTQRRFYCGLCILFVKIKIRNAKYQQPDKRKCGLPINPINRNMSDSSRNKGNPKPRVCPFLDAMQYLKYFDVNYACGIPP